MKLLPLLSLLALAPVAEAKSLIQTGGACASQGVWTSRALDQSRLILETAKALKDDPDCRPMADALQRFDAKAVQALLEQGAENDAAGARFETLPQDLSSLRTLLMENSANQTLATRLTPLLAKAAIDLSTSSTSLVGPLKEEDRSRIRQRMLRTSATGQQLLSAIFTAAPQSRLCFQKSKNLDQGLSLLSGTIRLMSAFASAEDQQGQRFASLVQEFNSFLREMKYTGILQKLNRERFWTDMSCLIETTQQSYCNARDGTKLLDYQAKETEVMASLRDSLARGSVRKDSAVEGYLLLQREVVAVTQWLQRVQFGIQPKVSTDATFKNATLDSVNTLMKTINTIQGDYSENLLIFKNLPTVQAKQQNIRELISEVVGTMDRGAGGSGNTVNFFTQALPREMIFFYLLGRNTIPDEVLGRTGSNVSMSPETYIKDVEKTKELQNPDALMATILERLTNLSELALAEGSKYFAQRMSVDHLNLVDDSLTDASVSVYQSIKNVRAYIAHLVQKYSLGKAQDQQVTLSMLDTLARLDRVLREFDAVFAIADEYNLQIREGALTLADLSKMPEEQRDRIRHAYSSLVTRAYLDFNVLLQRDSFFTQRVNTYVRFDLFQRMRTKEDMSPYLNYLIVASGRNVINRMQEFMSFNMAEAEADLAEAQRINRANLDQLEELFAEDTWTYINELARESGSPYVKRATDNPFRDLSKIVTEPHKKLWDTVTNAPGRTGRRNSQDEDGALALLRAKACVQTLGFKNWAQYKSVCEGAVLQSRLTAQAPSELRVKFAYDDLRKDVEPGLLGAVKTAIWGEPEGHRYKNVCAVRDYFRNNQVFWMTLEFQEAAGVSTTTLPKQAGGQVLDPFQ